MSSSESPHSTSFLVQDVFHRSHPQQPLLYLDIEDYKVSSIAHSITFRASDCHRTPSVLGTLPSPEWHGLRDRLSSSE